jgi:hypothetical protein
MLSAALRAPGGLGLGLGGLRGPSGPAPIPRPPAPRTGSLGDSDALLFGEMGSPSPSPRAGAAQMWPSTSRPAPEPQRDEASSDEEADDEGEDVFGAVPDAFKPAAFSDPQSRAPTLSTPQQQGRTLSAAISASATPGANVILQSAGPSGE